MPEVASRAAAAITVAADPINYDYITVDGTKWALIDLMPYPRWQRYESDIWDATATQEISAATSTNPWFYVAPIPDADKWDAAETIASASTIRYAPTTSDPAGPWGRFVSNGPVAASQLEPRLNATDWTQDVAGDSVVGPFNIPSQTGNIGADYQIRTSDFEVSINTVDPVRHAAVNGVRTEDNQLVVGANQLLGFSPIIEGGSIILDQYASDAGAGAIGRPWILIAIASSPATVTHEQRAMLDLSGTTQLAPLIVNVEVPPLAAGQIGEIELSDRSPADTWATGYLRLVFTDGAGTPVTVNVPTGATRTKQTDGIVNIDLQDIGSESLFLRYLPSGEEDIRVSVAGGAAAPANTFDDASPYVAGEDYEAGVTVTYAGDAASDPGVYESTAIVTNAATILDPASWVYRGVSVAANALVYPPGDFTAEPVNDSGKGSNGSVYFLPSVDALKITLPPKADMDLPGGVWRVRIAGDWTELAAQPTPLEFLDDSANGVDFGEGLPSFSNEWVDLVFDAAGDQWRALTGSTVTLEQVIPTYAEHGEVPAAVRVYLINGTGGAAAGLYRLEHGTTIPNYVG